MGARKLGVGGGKSEGQYIRGRRKVDVSVPIISYKPDVLFLKTLASIAKSDFPKSRYEVVVAYDIEPEVSVRKAIRKVVKESGIAFRMRHIEPGRGVGYSRNQAVKMCRGSYLVVTDADCEVGEHWLSKMADAILKSESDVAAVVGGVCIPHSTYLGDCISLLGFPGGGNIGFDKVHRVDKGGLTKQITNCNCGMKKAMVLEAGGYDEHLGIEDKGLALKLARKGYKVQYVPGVTVTHVPRTSFRSFCKWMFYRGVSSKVFFDHYGNHKAEMVSTRVWSAKNSLIAAGLSLRLTVVACLLSLAAALQAAGYLYEAVRPAKRKARPY